MATAVPHLRPALIVDAGQLKKTADGIFRRLVKNIPLLITLLEEFRGRFGLQALEIGVFEGRATCSLPENILTGKGSTIDCIDTFTGGIERRYRGIDMVR